MRVEFKTKAWSFLEVSRKYILGEVKALYQIMIAFFDTPVSKFPINPLSVLSAPSTALILGELIMELDNDKYNKGYYYEDGRHER